MKLIRLFYFPHYIYFMIISKKEIKYILDLVYIPLKTLW